MPQRYGRWTSCYPVEFSSSMTQIGTSLRPGNRRRLSVFARRPLAPTPRLQTASHMMIANPFGNVRNVFSTHPPMEERIARLVQMAKSDPRYLH